MTLVLTQVYLEPTQKKALAAEGKRRGRKPSDLMREAVEAMTMGVNVQDLQQLDAIIDTFDANAKQHRSFMTEIARLRRDAAGTPQPRAAAGRRRHAP